MAKYSYLSNSAKLMSVVSAFLFAANALLTIGSFSGNESLSEWGSSLSSLSLYIILALGYVALNGEGVGHKRYRDRKSKKVTGLLKLNLFFCFGLNFLRSGLEFWILTLNGAGGAMARVLMSVVSTVGSYGFFLCVVCLWYLFRDRSQRALLPLEILAFLFGTVYNIYKAFNYAVVKYQIDAFGDSLTELFSQNDLLKILSLFQFLFAVIMFVQVSVHYGKMGDKEQSVLDNNVKELPRARNVYKNEGYGIDTLEDDFLQT